MATKRRASTRLAASSTPIATVDANEEDADGMIEVDVVVDVGGKTIEHGGGEGRGERGDDGAAVRVRRGERDVTIVTFGARATGEGEGGERERERERVMVDSRS